MTGFHIIDGPYDGYKFSDNISWGEQDVVNLEGVRHYHFGYDGNTVLLSARERPEATSQRAPSSYKPMSLPMRVAIW